MIAYKTKATTDKEALEEVRSWFGKFNYKDLTSNLQDIDDGMYSVADIRRRLSFYALNGLLVDALIRTYMPKLAKEM